MKRPFLVAASVLLALCFAVPASSLPAAAFAAGPCTTTCYVNGTTGSDANNGDTPAAAKKTIQAALNQVSAGGTVRVFPGTYNESAPGSNPTTIAGTYQFGLFFGSAKPGITLMGVTAGNTPITNAAATQATINTDATNDFGTDGIFVEAANTTIRGVKIGPNASGDNKTIEVVADNFTLRYATTNIPNGGGSIYIDDFSAGGTVVKAYHILENIFPDGTSVDIASGAGNTGPLSGREIRGNSFDLGNNGYNGISFNGTTPAVGWFVNPVGGAIIKDNSFKNSSQYIRARGVYDNAQFNWKSFWDDNSFDRATVALSSVPLFAVQPYSYDVFTNTRRIAGTIQESVDHAAAGNTVLVRKGTYTENVTIPTALTLDGAGSSSKLIPAASGPVCGPGSLCPGASNLILVQANDVTIKDLLLDGNNPALTSGVLSGGVDVDARNGIITNHATGTWNNLTVQNVTVRNIYLRGVYASSGGTFNFHDNDISNVQGENASIAMFNFGGSGVMANNTVSYANDSIVSNWSTGTQYLNNSVSHSASGIHTDNNGGGGGVADLIQGNRVTDCPVDGYGIFVFVSYVPTTVKNNTVTGCALAFAAFGGGFSGPLATTVVRDNVFDGKNAPVTVANSSDGIYVTTDTLGYGETNVSVAFTNNSVKNFAFGLQVTQQPGATSSVTVDKSLFSKNGTGLDNEASTLTVTNSCIQKNTNGFVNRTLGTAGVTVAHQNSITGNTSFGISNLSANTLNAESNWWGSATGARTSGSNRISGGVDAIPFLTSDRNTCQFNASAAGAPNGDHGDNGDDDHGNDNGDDHGDHNNDDDGSHNHRDHRNGHGGHNDR